MSLITRREDCHDHQTKKLCIQSSGGGGAVPFARPTMFSQSWCTGAFACLRQPVHIVVPHGNVPPAPPAAVLELLADGTDVPVRGPRQGTTAVAKGGLLRVTVPGMIDAVFCRADRYRAKPRQQTLLTRMPDEIRRTVLRPFLDREDTYHYQLALAAEHDTYGTVFLPRWCCVSEAFFIYSYDSPSDIREKRQGAARYNTELLIEDNSSMAILSSPWCPAVWAHVDLPVAPPPKRRRSERLAARRG